MKTPILFIQAFVKLLNEAEKIWLELSETLDSNVSIKQPRQKKQS